MTTKYAAYGGLGRFGYDDSKTYPTGWPGAGTGRVALAGTQVHLSDAPTVAENALRLGDKLAGGFYPMPINWIIVDADGNGHYSTIQAAINAVDSHRENSSTWIGILIYPGTYTETLSIGSSVDYIMLIGFSNQTKITSAGTTLLIDDGSDNIEVRDLTIDTTDNSGQALVIGNCDNITINSCIISSAGKCCYLTMAANDEVSFIDTFFASADIHVYGGSSAASAKATFYRCSFYTSGSGINSLDIFSNLIIEMYDCIWWADNTCDVGIFHSGYADSSVLMVRCFLDNEMDDTPWAGIEEDGVSLTLYNTNGTGWPSWAVWIVTETVSIHKLVGENGEYITNVTDGHWRFYEDGGTKYIDMDFTGTDPVLGTNTNAISFSGTFTATEFVDSGGGNSSNWKTAYDERGSQIAGTHLGWAGGNLNVADDWYDSIGDLPTAVVTDNDTTHIPTCDSVFEFCETTQGYVQEGDSPEFANVYVPIGGIIGFEGSGGDTYIYWDSGSFMAIVLDNSTVLDLSTARISSRVDFYASANLHVGTESGEYAKFIGGSAEGFIQSAEDHLYIGLNTYYDGSAWVNPNTSLHTALITLKATSTVSAIAGYFGSKEQPPTNTKTWEIDNLTGEFQLLTGFIDQDGATANTFASDINAAAGINVGTASDAGTGDVELSGTLNINTTDFLSLNITRTGGGAGLTISNTEQIWGLQVSSGADGSFIIRDRTGSVNAVEISADTGDVTLINDLALGGSLTFPTNSQHITSTEDKIMVRPQGWLEVQPYTDSHGFLARSSNGTYYFSFQCMDSGVGRIRTYSSSHRTFLFENTNGAYTVSLEVDGSVTAGASIHAPNLKSGVTQVAADAAAGEVWVDNNKMLRLGV